MFRRNCAGVGLVVMLWTGGAAAPKQQVLPSIAACRHDQSSNPDDRIRRNQAVALAKAINAAQADQARRTRQYQPLASLHNLPEVPSGFSLSLYADGSGYIFAIKDTRDPCRFAVFSDSAGLLYEKSAFSAPVIAQ